MFWGRGVRSVGVIWYGFTQGLRLKNTAKNDWRFLHGKSGEEKCQVKKKFLRAAIICIPSKAKETKGETNEIVVENEIKL